MPCCLKQLAQSAGQWCSWSSYTQTACTGRGLSVQGYSGVLLSMYMQAGRPSPSEFQNQGACNINVLSCSVSATLAVPPSSICSLLALCSICAPHILAHMCCTTLYNGCQALAGESTETAEAFKQGQLWGACFNRHADAQSDTNMTECWDCLRHAACCAGCLRLALLPTMAARRLSNSSWRCIRLVADKRSLKSLCLSTLRKSSLSASSFPSNCSGSYLHACMPSGFRLAPFPVL